MGFSCKFKEYAPVIQIILSVTFCRSGAPYFAIAFENIKGGYEVRNPYYKGCFKGKDYPSSGTTGMSSKDTSAFICYLMLHKKGDYHVCVDSPTYYLL